MANTKKVVIGSCALVLVVIALQNTETVATRLLFWSVSMPRVVLLLLTLAFGFAAGFVISTRRTRGKDKQAL